MASITELDVNGTRRRIDADGDRSLLSVLRDDLDLTGTKFGCGEGQCAACTVLVDGQPMKSCITKVASVAARRIVTIEGLAPAGKLTDGLTPADVSSPTTGSFPYLGLPYSGFDNPS